MRWLVALLLCAALARAGDPELVLRGASDDVAALHSRALAGDARAWADLGLRLELARDVKRDLDGALACFRRAADLGDARGRSWLATRLELDARNTGETSQPYRALHELAAAEEPFSAYRCAREAWGRPCAPTEAALRLRDAAQADDPRAHHELGRAAELGLLGLRRDERAARERFTRAAALGWTPADLALGASLEWGQPPDLDEALALYARTDGAGDPRGAVAAAGLLSRRRGDGDLELARAALERAVERRLVEAHEALARLAGTSPAAALDLLRRGAELGSARCMALVGDAHERGLGVPPDADLATRWYRRALEAAPAVLAELAFTSRGKLSEARRWLDRGVALGDRECMTDLAIMRGYDDRAPRDPDDDALLRRAAAAGSRGAWRELGERALRAGDLPAAVQAFETAAEAGEPRAMTELGRMLELGEGLAADPVLAASWYRRAADAGDGEGMARLGWCLERGLHAAKDSAAAQALYDDAFAIEPFALRSLAMVSKPDVALVWLRRGADRGDASAMRDLAELLRAHDVDHDGPDDAEGRAWLRRAAEGDDLGAMLDLGDLHRDGAGVPRDDVEALRWYRVAAKRGFSSALGRVDELLLRRPDLR